ncbi:MAG: AraC family transcriptional regulator, partial [Flavitalea sp.]
MLFYIKNMVCNRCILVVEQELQKLEIDYNKVTMGEVETQDDLSKEKLTKLSTNLSALGFEILDDAKRQLIEKMKNLIIKQIHHSQEEDQQRYSDLLAKSLHKDYSYLSG